MADESKTDGRATAAVARLADMPAAAFGTFEYVDGSAEPAVIEAAVTAALDDGACGVQRIIEAGRACDQAAMAWALTSDTLT